LLICALALAERDGQILVSTNCSVLGEHALEVMARYSLKTTRRAAKLHRPLQLPDFPSGSGASSIWLELRWQFDARNKGSKYETLSEMDQLSAESVAEFPERGMQWVKDRVEAMVNETGEYVREKPTQSLLYAFAAGYILNRLPLGRVLGGFLRLL